MKINKRKQKRMILGGKARGLMSGLGLTQLEQVKKLKYLTGIIMKILHYRC